MKSLQNQYNLIKEGKGHKDVFLKSVKRLFPDLIPNHFGFNETTTILKQRGIITEAAMVGGLVSRPAIDPFNTFNNFLSEEFSVAENPVDAPKPKGEQTTKAENKKMSKEVEDLDKETGYDYTDYKNIDNIYGEAFLEGYYAEMKDPKNADKTVDELKGMVAKNMAKDSLYYMKNAAFGVKGIGYQTEVPGLGTPKEPTGKYKSSGYGDLKESILEIAKEINEEYGMSLDDATTEAKRISAEEGVVQHVEEIPDAPGRFRVSDWYDSDYTVISFEDGREL
jgi:hypothetical protein